MEFVECPAWDAIITVKGCNALQKAANLTALKIINHESVLAAPESQFLKLIACMMCSRFNKEYKQKRLDEVISEVHQKCLTTLDFKETSSTVSRYKKWYDKHGKEYKQKQRAAQKLTKEN